MSQSHQHFWTSRANTFVLIRALNFVFLFLGKFFQKSEPAAPRYEGNSGSSGKFLMGEAVSPVAGAAGDLVQISQAKISDQADGRPSERRVTASKYQDLFYSIYFHGTIFYKDSKLQQY